MGLTRKDTRRVLAMVAGATLLVVGGCGDAEGGNGVTRNEPEATRLDTGDWEADVALPGPDGQSTALVASLRDDALTRVVVVRDGRRTAVSASEQRANDAAWFPGGDAVLVAYYGEGGRLSLRRHPVDGGPGVDVPLARDIGPARGMAVAADGRTAVVSAPGHATVYSEHNDLFRVDLTSGAVEQLTDTPEESEQYPSLLADGRVAFAAGRLTTVAGGPNGYVGVLDPGSGTKRRLTDETQSVSSVSAWRTWIVYEAFPGNERDQQAFWAVQADGGGPRRLDVPPSARLPKVVPSGDAVMYVDVGAPGRMPAVRTTPVALPAT